MGSLAAQFDAVVIGGGIQGLTFASEAARRGRSVLVLEAERFGAGSTTASLGIVHGGFRYWQDFDIARLVRSRREQAWYQQTFPGLVRPLPCLLPFGRRDRQTPALFAAAALAQRAVELGTDRRGPALPPPRLVGRHELLTLAPWLAEQDVGGAGCWYDLEITDPAGLVAALVRHAAAGVSLLEGVEAVGVSLGPRGEVRGVTARDRGAGSSQFVSAPVVVNCAGSALDRVARLAHPNCPRFFSPLPAFNLRLSMATRLASAFAVGRGQRLFLRPDPSGVLAGTFYEPDLPEGAPLPIERWLDALHVAAAGLDLHREHVLAVLAGVLPADGAAPARRDVIVDHARVGGPAGLFSISGVKLTTARWLSARAVGQIWPGTYLNTAAPTQAAAA